MAPTPAAAFVAGRYVLRERLGAGASGEVWSADDPQIGRRVAIKLLRIPDGLSAEMRNEWENRFLLESRAAGRLSHPGIVSIHDVGTASDGRPFIVMELVDGQNLDALRRAEPPPALERLIQWTIEVAEALDAAHRRGVVHRDVKPANILVGTDGRARVADFGIARVAESELTRDGAFVGSPAFAAPEQLRGAKVDGRADLFALGAVLYLLATRRRPFEGEDVGAIAYAVCHVDPARPSSRNPELDPALDAVILRALQKEPDARFQTGHDLADALRAAEADVPPQRTLVAAAAQPATSDAKISAASTAEDRAVSIASAVAVSVVRASRATVEQLRALGSALGASSRRAAPHVRQVIVDFGERVEAAWPGLRGRRGWLAAGLAIAVSIAILAGRSWNGREEAPRPGHVFERLRGLVGGKSSRVNVLVTHGLEGGTIVLSGDHGILLEESLEAPRKDLLGLSFLSYRSGTDTSTFRLDPGRHALRVRITGPDGLDLARTMTVQIDPRSEYDLRISVATWPRARLSADWDRVEE